ncbi:hypothetical protein J6590_012751 [Homalodisca vitripennis]|nr:hypothetical protein J6590_012751 [Homalodisca vitripennis]
MCPRIHSLSIISHFIYHSMLPKDWYALNGRNEFLLLTVTFNNKILNVTDSTAIIATSQCASESPSHGMP